MGLQLELLPQPPSLQLVPLPSTLQRAAEVSDCGTYRYWLERTWDARFPRILFVMLNPSTADAAKDDPTLRKCMGFARRWNYGSLAVVNLYAFRATKPKELRAVLRTDKARPVGNPRCDVVLRFEAGRVSQIVVAWGKNLDPDRIATVVALLRGAENRPLWCIATTQDGQPGHPLMRAYARTLQLWSPP